MAKIGARMVDSSINGVEAERVCGPAFQHEVYPIHLASVARAGTLVQKSRKDIEHCFDCVNGYHFNASLSLSQFDCYTCRNAPDICTHEISELQAAFRP